MKKSITLTFNGVLLFFVMCFLNTLPVFAEMANSDVTKYSITMDVNIESFESSRDYAKNMFEENFAVFNDVKDWVLSEKCQPFYKTGPYPEEVRKSVFWTESRRRWDEKADLYKSESIYENFDLLFSKFNVCTVTALNEKREINLYSNPAVIVSFEILDEQYECEDVSAPPSVGYEKKSVIISYDGKKTFEADGYKNDYIETIGDGWHLIMSGYDNIDLPELITTTSSDYEYELDLTCSSTKYFDDEDTTTYFYVETDYEGESITLVNADDLTEYTMLDDGKFSISGDDMPYDAVYSLRLELNTDGVTYENPKVLSFYAITEDGVISDTITIKIIKRITTLQISEMASVDEMINTLVESENYTSASFEEKTSMVYDLLVNLAEHGTEEYPYSLIFSNSISFTGTIYSFKYSCGSLGGVPIADPFQTTEPTGVGSGTTTETTVTTTLTTSKATTTATVTTTEVKPNTEQTTEPPVTGVTTETSTVPPTTTTGTETTLPQTGYSKWYQALIAAAMGMIGVGSTAIVKSGIFRKKENNS